MKKFRNFVLIGMASVMMLQVAGCAALDALKKAEDAKKKQEEAKKKKEEQKALLEGPLKALSEKKR